MAGWPGATIENQAFHQTPLYVAMFFVHMYTFLYSDFHMLWQRIQSKD